MSGHQHFVFANQGEDAHTVRAFLTQQGLEIDNVVLDRAGLARQRTGAPAMPTTLFFGKDGRLAARHVGELDSVELARYLAALAGRP